MAELQDPGIGIRRSRMSNDAGFYKEFKPMNPFIIMILILLSLGFYIINWIYIQNKELEKILDDAPDSTRGAFLLLVIPLFWTIISLILTYIVVPLTDAGNTFKIFNIMMWTIIVGLMLLYLYDFCRCFSKVNRTDHRIWFLFMCTGLLGILGLVFMNFYMIPLMFFLIITVPAMQAEMNSYYSRFDVHRRRDTFYDV